MVLLLLLLLSSCTRRILTPGPVCPIKTHFPPACQCQTRSTPSLHYNKYSSICGTSSTKLHSDFVQFKISTSGKERNVDVTGLTSSPPVQHTSTCLCRSVCECNVYLVTQFQQFLVLPCLCASLGIQSFTGTINTTREHTLSVCVCL